MVKAYLFEMIRQNDRSEIHAFTYAGAGGRHFAPYATDFEKMYSVLAGETQAEPVVAPQATGAKIPAVAFECRAFDYAVVGHIGWFSGADIYGTSDNPGLENARGNDKIIVRRPGRSPRGYHQLHSSEQKYHLITDIDGKVILSLKGSSSGWVTSSSAFETAVIASVRKVLGVTTVDLLTILIPAVL